MEMVTLYLIKFFDFDGNPILLKIGVTIYSMRNRMSGYSVPLEKKVVFKRKFSCAYKARNFERGITQWGLDKRFAIQSSGTKQREWFYYSKKVENKIIRKMKSRKHYIRKDL